MLRKQPLMLINACIAVVKVPCMCDTRVLIVMRLMQVLLAAGDTFRAAAAEQLQLWAGRSGVAVHAATRENARPDNVLYEAVDKASYDLLCSYLRPESCAQLSAMKFGDFQPLSLKMFVQS